jgi:nucleoside-diphosphate-sugar epimerase
MIIYITGSTGFIGRNFLRNFSEKKFIEWKRNDDINIGSAGVVIHLAAKAHDQRNTTTPAEYYHVNLELTKKVFDAFLLSDAKVFINLSSVKAVADDVEGELTEDFIPKPITHYGKSKLLAEEYILSKEIPSGKRVYILRPCMIHGEGNKGNLNLLYKFALKGLPWPLGSYENKRSFCSIDNLMFIFKELLEREDIASGVYNVADDMPLSTKEVISVLAISQNNKPKIWNVPKGLIELGVKIGSRLKLSLNEEHLRKLTGSYVVSNRKLAVAIAKPLPLSSKEGLIRTFKSFQKL